MHIFINKKGTFLLKKPLFTLRSLYIIPLWISGVENFFIFKGKLKK